MRRARNKDNRGGKVQGIRPGFVRKQYRKDVDYMKEVTLVLNGTIYSSTEVLVDTTLAGVGGFSFKTEAYKQATLDRLLERLPSMKSWTVTTLLLMDDKYGKISYRTITEEITGHKANSGEFNNFTHKMKVSIVDNTNPMYIRGLYTIAQPLLHLTEEMVDASCQCAMAKIESQGGFNLETVSTCLRLRLTENMSYVDKLKEAGVWGDLGKTILTMVNGFEDSES